MCTLKSTEGRPFSQGLNEKKKKEMEWAVQAD